MSIKIVIADDHMLIREGLRQLLELDGDIEVIGEAGSGMECLSIISKKTPQVLLLDINMLDLNGLEVLTEIRKQNMPVKVLILTIHNEVEYLLRAVDIGIDGYLLKDSESSELKKAIFSVVRGESYIQPILLPTLNSKLLNRDVEKNKVNELTRRELEILKLLAEGLFNKEIAYNLKISERTVKNHISNIFKKICVADRTQAAVFAIRNNIVDIF